MIASDTLECKPLLDGRRTWRTTARISRACIYISALAVIAFVWHSAFDRRAELSQSFNGKSYIPPGEVLPYKQSAFRDISDQLRPVSKETDDKLINREWQRDAENKGEFGDGNKYGQKFGDHGLYDIDEKPSVKNKRNGWQSVNFQKVLSAFGVPDNVTSGLQRLGVSDISELKDFNEDAELPSYPCDIEDGDPKISGHRWCGELKDFVDGGQGTDLTVKDTLDDKSLPQPKLSLLEHLEEPDDLASSDDWPADFPTLTEAVPGEVRDSELPSPPRANLWWADFRANLSKAQIRTHLRAVDKQVQPFLPTLSGERPLDDPYFYCYSISGEDPEFSQCLSDLQGANDPRTGRSIARPKPWKEMVKGLWNVGEDGEPVSDDPGDAVPSADGPVMDTSWRTLTRGLWARHGAEARATDPAYPEVNFGRVYHESNGMDYR